MKRFILLILIVFIVFTASAHAGETTSSLWDYFSDIGGAIWDMLSSIVEGIKAAFEWMIDRLWDLAIQVLVLFSLVWPDNWKCDLTSVTYHLGVANHWVDISFGASLFFGYYAFCAVFSIVKFVLKLIPTIG